MGRNATCWTLALLGVLLAACAKPPAKRVIFSEALRERYRLGEPELRGLQYYISHEIVLERTAQGGTRRVDQGRLIVRGGVNINQVIVPFSTPGKVEPESFVGDGERTHILEVSFTPGLPLRFAPHEPGGAYLLEAPRRALTRSFADLFSGQRRPRKLEVPFADETWRVVAGANAYLMIEADALERLSRTRVVLPGVRGEDED